MLSFFKTNDPYRLVVVFILLLLIRIPMLMMGVPLIVPELKWLLIGERLGSGNFIMYQDLWDHTAPLSVFAYKWLFALFGKARWSYQAFSILLVIIQAGIFNNIMLKNKAYNHNTYVPALIYMLFMNAYFDFMTLSPILMSMTFILLSINNLFKRMDNQTKDELFIFTGIYLGIATLLYLPSFFFLIVTLISLLLFTGSILRRLLLLIYGYVLVLVLAGLYFYWHDAYLIFQYHYLESLWNINPNSYLSGMDLILMTAIPVLILLVSIFQMNKLSRYINFQVKMQRVMLMFLLFGLLSLFWMKESASYQLIFFVPSVAFFVAHYLLAIRNWLSGEANFILITALILLNHLFLANHWLFVDQFVSYDRLIVGESEYADIVQDKQILVIGDEMQHYKDAKLGSAYLDWRLSKVELEHLDYYDNSADILKHFLKDRPQVIIDHQEVMPAILKVMPTLAAAYHPHQQYANIYLLTTDE